MADRETKENREAAQSGEGQAPAAGGVKKLRSPRVLAALGAAVLIAAGGAFVLLKPSHGAAEGKHGRDPDDVIRKMRNEWQWDIGEVWVSHKDLKMPANNRRITAKFKLLASKDLKNKLEKDAEDILKSEVKDLIESVLSSRVTDVQMDVQRAKDLIRADIMRGLKTGVNPNKPEAKNYDFPFNESNLFEVYVGELQDSRW